MDCDFDCIAVNPENVLIEGVGRGEPPDADAARFPGGTTVRDYFNAHSHLEQPLFYRDRERR